MNLEELKFVINNDGNVTKEEEKELLLCYKEYFQEIYGYDILSDYENNKKNLKKSLIFQDAFVNSIDILKSIKEDENLSLLTVYDNQNNIIGFARIKIIKEREINNPIIKMANNLLEKHLNMTIEKCVSIPDIAISSEYEKEKYEIWMKIVGFVENIVTTQGYDRLYVEIPINSPLLFRADDLGFIESPEDIPISTIPRTRILNKSLERNRDEEFNFSR